MFDTEIEQIFLKNKDLIFTKICAAYDIDQNDLQLVGEFENYVYQYNQGNKVYILRLSHSSHRTEDLIYAELHWINYLTQTLKQIPQVHLSQNETFLERIDLEDSHFIAAVFDKAKGTHPQLKEDWTDSLYYQWGKLLGKMHSLTKEYKPKKGKQRPHWYEVDLYEHAPDILSQNHELVLQKFAEVNSTLLNLPASSENYGLIHNDLHMWNFYVSDETITPFDFDDCQYGWFIQDIAHILFHVGQYNPLKQYDVSFIRNFVRHFFAGYKTENTLHSQDVELIPLFLKRFELLAYIVIHEDEAFDDPWCARFLKNRKKRIEDNVPYFNLEDYWVLFSE